jgi:CubicO group peptidase (beta-lactamase class C family)
VTVSDPPIEVRAAPAVAVDVVEGALRRSLARRWHTGGLLHGSVGGEPVLDAAIGHDGTGARASIGAPVHWSCTSKLSLVIAFARLWQLGAVHPDDPVAAHIPEFGPGGHDAVTIRHILTHTTGLAEDTAPLLNSGTPWATVLERICAGRPIDRPGATASYSTQTGWFLLAEMLARVTGGEPREVDEQLGLRAAGATSALVAPACAPPAAHYRPGRSTSGPLSELAAVCRALAPGPSGREDHLDETVRVAVTRPWRTGLTDTTTGTDTPWGLGVAVDGRLFGNACSPMTFGHLGAPETFVLFDPRADVGIAAHFFGVRQTMHGTAIRYLVTEAVMGALAP